MKDLPNNPAPVAKRNPDCLLCEAILTDALDGTLSPAEERVFTLHLGTCAPCTEAFAEAQRGAAWLELLKNPRPQPRPELLSAILAQTSGSALAPQLEPDMIPATPAGRLMAFPSNGGLWHRFGQVLLEPRLAMTAAMAFFSIAMTLSLTGVRINELHGSDLGPSGVRRILHTAQAGAIRYYDNLRVVHVMESRVDDLRENLRDARPEPVAPKPAPDNQPAKPKSAAPTAPDGGSSRVQPADALPAAATMSAQNAACGLNPLFALIAPWRVNGDPA